MAEAQDDHDFRHHRPNRGAQHWPNGPVHHPASAQTNPGSAIAPARASNLYGMEAAAGPRSSNHFQSHLNNNTISSLLPRLDQSANWRPPRTFGTSVGPDRRAIGDATYPIDTRAPHSDSLMEVILFEVRALRDEMAEMRADPLRMHPGPYTLSLQQDGDAAGRRLPRTVDGRRTSPPQTYAVPSQPRQDTLVQRHPDAAQQPWGAEPEAPTTGRRHPGTDGSRGHTSERQDTPQGSPEIMSPRSRIRDRNYDSIIDQRGELLLLFPEYEAWLEDNILQPTEQELEIDGNVTLGLAEPVDAFQGHWRFITTGPGSAEEAARIWNGGGPISAIEIHELRHHLRDVGEPDTTRHISLVWVPTDLTAEEDSADDDEEPTHSEEADLDVNPQDEDEPDNNKIKKRDSADDSEPPDPNVRYHTRTHGEYTLGGLKVCGPVDTARPDDEKNIISMDERASRSQTKKVKEEAESTARTPSATPAAEATQTRGRDSRTGSAARTSKGSGQTPRPRRRTRSKAGRERGRAGPTNLSPLPEDDEPRDEGVDTMPLPAKGTVGADQQKPSKKRLVSESVPADDEDVDPPKKRKRQKKPKNNDNHKGRFPDRHHDDHADDDDLGGKATGKKTTSLHRKHGSAGQISVPSKAHSQRQKRREDMEQQATPADHEVDQDEVELNDVTRAEAGHFTSGRKTPEDCGQFRNTTREREIRGSEDVEDDVYANQDGDTYANFPSYLQAAVEDPSIMHKLTPIQTGSYHDIAAAAQIEASRFDSVEGTTPKQTYFGSQPVQPSLSLGKRSASVLDAEEGEVQPLGKQKKPRIDCCKPQSVVGSGADRGHDNSEQAKKANKPSKTGLFRFGWADKFAGR